MTKYKALGEIATEFYRGSGIKRDQITSDGILCIRYGEIYTTYNIYFDTCISHTKEEYVTNPKYCENSDILFAITGESVEDIGKSCAYIGHEKCLVGGDIVVMKHNQNPKYISYALSTENARLQKSKGKIKSKVVHTNLLSIKEIKIPLPSLEKQERIVKILDELTEKQNELIQNLMLEVTARKKQYEYYLNKILSS